MKKYYLGLIFLGLLTLGLGGYVISLGLQSRQDAKTEKKVQEISETLNSYVDANQTIPEDLEEAGIKDVPSTISYTKLSEEKYEFCATYKAAKGYSGGGVTSLVTGAVFAGLTGVNSSSYDSDAYYDYEPSALYPSYYYTKGKNCQTIKPYLATITPDDDSSTPYWCEPTYAEYESYKQYCSLTQ